jgi:DNA polymerase-3 subunit beta
VKGDSVTVTEDFLKTTVMRTAFAAAREKMHYALNGALFNVKGKEFEVVATDGRRMALVQEKGIDAGKGFSGIIPAKALALLERLTLGGDKKVKITIGKNQASFRISEAVLSTRLVEGHFPNYETILPKEGPNRATVDRAGLLAAVRAASLITTQDSKAIRLAFGKKGLTVASSSPETGEAALQVDAQYEGEDVEIAFNPDYITGFLRCVEEEKVSVEMGDASKAALFTVGPAYRYVLMPITGPA